jgi:hypothetical protein
MKNSLFLLALLFSSSAIAQQTKEGETIKLTGFMKSDFIYDSRQTISIREGHFLLYPANEVLDPNSNDINDKANFNSLSIQTRLNAKIAGPEALGAKTSGTIEGEFFGTTDADVNGFRLRHAFITLSWSATTLLVGQTWHPMFITDVFPQVVSFNTGVPFQPFSRNPQIRLTHTVGDMNLILALCSQRDFTSNGPSGFSSSYLRNSVIPNAHFQVQYKSESIVSGAGIDLKTLTPRLETTKKYSTDQKVSSSSVLGYLKIKSGNLAWLIEGVYGGNNTDLMQLGGYGVKSIDAVTGKEEYEPLKSFSLWSDISLGTDIQPGIFIGYSKNLGSENELIGTLYTRVSNIDIIYRVSPRVVFNLGKLRIAAELELTTASYGTVDKFAKVNNTKNITNVRGLAAMYLFF